jgi:hypothetical protein
MRWGAALRRIATIPDVAPFPEQRSNIKDFPTSKINSRKKAKQIKN